MEAVCVRGDGRCQAYALAAALHSLNLYCAAIFTALICCCGRKRPARAPSRWRCQNVRGITSIVLGVVWCCGAAAASLRPADTVYLVASLMAPLSWLAAAAFHVSLWTRRSLAPTLYLAVYWFLTTLSSAALLFEHSKRESFETHVEVYIQGLTLICAIVMGGADCLCFYDEVAKYTPTKHNQKSPNDSGVIYKYNETHFYGKITFFWLNSLLYKGCDIPLETDDLGPLPDEEKSKTCYEKFEQNYSNKYTRKSSLWKTFVLTVWPNFYIAGILKLFGDLMGVIAPLGLGIIIQFMDKEQTQIGDDPDVSIDEFFDNGYAMLMVVTLSLILQALLSQNSTHLLTVEGTKLKSSLQNMVFDKCMRLASWSSDVVETDELSPLLQAPKSEESSQTGMLMNLVSQDTYNIMSCVWICHYTWAIPLKISVILYLLYTKLGVSAIIGAATSIIVITPLQFYLGKKISDNSRNISKCTDHRVSKMSEILQGMNVIKLYVWEDLFNEKILQLREVELKHLNRDSICWGLLTFTTQCSSVLVTIVTFTMHYFLGKTNHLTTVNVFAGLALFNQLTIPLLILPVTVLMVIQALVSTKRIRDFLDLPESKNNQIDKNYSTKCRELDEGLIIDPKDKIFIDDANDAEINDTFPEDGTMQSQDYLIKYRNAAFSWGIKDNLWLEIEDLDIPAGKLIMVVGSSGSGKTSLLAAMVGEMQYERGHIDNCNGYFSSWYAGQPPWLLDWSIRDNILMKSPWCATRYAKVVRATGLRPDLQLLPDGDDTVLGSYGSPLSGGQRVRVCIARALYSQAQLIALDEPLGALDAPLARHVVARALLPAARSGRTILLATSRLELLHYADFVIVMEGGRVSCVGRPGVCEGALNQWWSLAGEARAAAARSGAGPPGGTAQERSLLIRSLSRNNYQRSVSEDNIIAVSEATGAHLLAEVSMCTGGTWRRTSRKTRTPLERQLSSPPTSAHNHKLRREVRRSVSADATNGALQRDGSLLRRILRPPSQRALIRWTPRTLRRLISSDSDTNVEIGCKGTTDDSTFDATFTTITSNGVESNAASDSRPSKAEPEILRNESAIWKEYLMCCGWWGVMYCVAAAAGQGLAVAADCWLSRLAENNTRQPLSDNQMWDMVQMYAGWCACGVCAGGFAQAACASAGAAARRMLHDKLLRATLNAPLHHHHATPQGAYIHRFSNDISVVDKKLPTAVSRWTQLALLCGAAFLVNIILSPWTLLVLLPALLFFIALQSVYLKNASELQNIEANSAAGVVTLTAQTSTGAATVRAGQLQTRLRDVFQNRVDINHNALLLLNASNRWLGLGLDLVGACTVFTSLSVALYSGSAGAVAGLAGTYALILPIYLAHLAKCRADLHLQLASLERIITDINVPQEDYRDDCPIPAGWQRNGKIEFQEVSVQQRPNGPTILKNINVTVKPGQKIAVCGRSGSGKSTLLLTCTGATTIQSGRVLIDGQDITRIPLKPLRHRIVVLPQETTMFSGTLRENLDPLAVHTDEEIWQCLKAVGLYDFVTAQSAGLECSISKHSGWAGGRGGRVCAARAALHARPAAALLLDEPAAALDAPAQRVLLRALATLAPHTTIITVAHRISSVREYDSSIILEDGRIVERGDINALLSEPFSKLSRMLTAPNYVV
ncbi:ATP-binding cassette sub-family C member Sur [Zerene cesonia]|uniref:ATP-binding cassette sub-family C member Sur n=1 Tax=Zerene cesonia TaxID=33412 RepID=UPI0018E58B5F|nr:ATP-binding cassette sub-family C member Sur [Zerene cesonia]